MKKKKSQRTREKNKKGGNSRQSFVKPTLLSFLQLDDTRAQRRGNLIHVRSRALMVTRKREKDDEASKQLLLLLLFREGPK